MRYTAQMGDVINLNKVRKAKARAQSRRDAAANRAKHGRTGADKAADRMALDKQVRDLDGQRRDDPSPTDD